MLPRASDDVRAQMLEYGMLALDMDFALSRILASSKVGTADIEVLDKAEKALDLAREGEGLVKEPRLTRSAVIAMKLYGSFLRSGSTIGEDVLGSVEELLRAIRGAAADPGISPDAREAATKLRDFFRTLGDDALAACGGPLETVRVHQC